MALKTWNINKLKLHNAKGQSQSLGKHVLMLWSPKIPWSLKKKMKRRSPNSTMPPSIYGIPRIACPNSPTKDNALKLTISNLFQILHDRLQWDLISFMIYQILIHHQNSFLVELIQESFHSQWAWTLPQHRHNYKCHFW